MRAVYVLCYHAPCVLLFAKAGRGLMTLPPSPSTTEGTDIAGMKDSYLTGDLAFDPLSLAPKSDVNLFLSQRSKELNNGRLAMLAWVRW